uniref:Serpin domain-containing protein n=1 Tax=Panagrolaimus davidi TaxID=227884 RepID=A0A914Q6U0_9BILA
MILAGSDGNTAVEILNVISKENSSEKVVDYISKSLHRTSKLLEDETTDKPPVAKKSKTNYLQNIKTFKIMIANGLFVNESAKIVEEYKAVVKEKFNGHVQKLDFGGDKNKSVEVINKFVNDKTNGKIKKLMNADDLKHGSAIVIINAVYFAGRWDEPFKEKLNATFYSSPQRRHSMMSSDFYSINFTKGDDWECVGIPYMGRKVWFFIVLPKKRNGLEELIKKMDYSMFKKFVKEKLSSLTITMPIFKVEADYDLVEIFKKLGIKDLFEESCDLSKMMKDAQYVSKAVHKAVIDVNEFGTEAAAVTIAMSVPASGGVLNV